MNQGREQKPQVMITQFTEATDKHGNQYFYGTIGMLTVNLFRTKTNPNKWKLVATQKERKPDDGFGFNQDNGDDGFNFG